MTAKEIIDEIKPLGSENYKRVIFNRGVTEPCFGVKVSDLQKIVKRVKKDYQLALDLYDTGIYDARYLAGLIADDERAIFTAQIQARAELYAGVAVILAIDPERLHYFDRASGTALTQRVSERALV